MPEAPTGLMWPPMVKGTLLKRYQRFLADVVLENGSTVTAHCPNTGSMTNCCEPGRPVYLSVHDNPKRKYMHTWELIQMPDSLVGVNTLVPNRLVKQAVRTGQVAELAGYAGPLTVEVGQMMAEMIFLDMFAAVARGERTPEEAITWVVGEMERIMG